MTTNAAAKSWCTHPRSSRKDQLSLGGDKIAEICGRCFLVFPVDPVIEEPQPRGRVEQPKCDHAESFEVRSVGGALLGEKCSRCGRIRAAGTEKWKKR